MAENMGYGGAIMPNDVATLALLGGGRGYGYGGGNGYGSSYLTAQAHADGTGLGNRMTMGHALLTEQVKQSESATKFGLEANANAFSEGRQSNEFNRLNDVAWQNRLDITDKLDRIQLNNLRDIANRDLAQAGQIADVRRDIADSAKDTAKCCCDAQLMATQNQAMTMAAIAALETRGISRELDAAQSRITQLETIDALRDRDHRR